MQSAVPVRAGGLVLGVAVVWSSSAQQAATTAHRLNMEDLGWKPNPMLSPSIQGLYGEVR